MAEDPSSASASAPYQSGNKNDQQRSYDAVKSALLNHEHVFYSPPTSPHKLLIVQSQSQTQQQQRGESRPSNDLPTIASLSIHPVLESLLHLLNCDLPSAHFLCRHAEVEPKYEFMYVHGILHRIEGDVDNTRAWYGDVKDTEAFQHTWGEEAGKGAPEIASKGSEHFLDRLERYRDRSKSRQGTGGREQDVDKLNPKDVKDWAKEEELLRETSLWEFKKVLQFCENKFGLGELKNASEAFLGKMESGDEEYAKVAQNMVTGGEGWRTF
ncbi:hypothetical protein PMZ80_006046 [Knufia obscura]|uniref:Uncharacterized protein n=2 Tax=Knufia TaxID=430999 RepID=A0AAN8FAQ1_9EURO|nr:hypothetical protein PMZ80_006046 [Knufia obscura]KAK5954716.1 hypothetical protein OHC33_004440 [Knufia fluminis]